MGYFKTILQTALSAVIITTMIPMTVFAAASGTIIGNSVNIRAAADDNAQVIGQGTQGSELILQGKSGDWFQVSYDGNNNAFISKDFFKVTRAEGKVTNQDVNVRSGPSTNSSVLKQVSQGDVITAIAQNNDWYQLAYNDGNAYISKDYLSGEMLSYLTRMAEVSAPADAGGTTQAAVVNNTYGVVNVVGSLRMRSVPSTDATVVTKLTNGQIVTVLEVNGQWLNVKLDNGQTGYVSAEFVSVRTGEPPSRSNAGGKGEQVAAYAKQYLGTPYVWGGSSLKTGVDCSGFVYAVMKNFGVTVNRSSAAMYSNGVAVSKEELVPGDLVFFSASRDGQITHVGIYTGGGEYIHSSTDNTGVIMSSLNSAYGKNTYVGAKRVLR